MKHLNPRQGITTFLPSVLPSRPAAGERVKHLNPRQGITTWIYSDIGKKKLIKSVKHLNPRQGITTGGRTSLRFRWSRCDWIKCETPKSPPGDYNLFCPNLSQICAYIYICVKHLNPRQGITTEEPPRWLIKVEWMCETPKSPPGDYNRRVGMPSERCGSLSRGVKHLNPRQGITTVPQRPGAPRT